MTWKFSTMLGACPAYMLARAIELCNEAVDAYLRWAIPEKVLCRKAWARQTKTLMLLSLLLKLVGVCALLYNVLLERTISPASSLTLISVSNFWVHYFALRWTENPALLAEMFCAWGHISLFGFCMIDTGVTSEYYMWYVLFPTLAFVQLGEKAGIISLVAVMCETILLLYLVPVSRLTGQAVNVVNPVPVVIRRLIIIFAVGFVTLFYERSRSNTLARLEQLVQEKEEANTRLQQATEAKTRFLANMSHELRTPMHGIIALSKDLLEGAFMNGHAREDLQTINDCAEHMLSIISDILDFEKIEADKFELESTAFDIVKHTYKAHKLLTVNARNRKVRLDSPHVDVRYPIHIGDPLRFRQIIVNLLSNAIKFTSEGGVVSLAITNRADDPERIDVEVADTGIGIAPESMPHLFQSFSQVDSGVARRYGGTGLGLAICKKLCTAMKGSISVKSELHKGSVFSFYVYLPVGNTPQTEQAAQNSSTDSCTDVDVDTEHTALNEQIDTKGANVLLVEDNMVNQKVAKRMLEEIGCRVTVASNGQQAVDIVEATGTNHFEVVLMDVQMPVMDGFEATRRIREWENRLAVDHEDGRLPIIALTAAATTDYLKECQAAGMNEFMTKPVSKATVQKMVQKWIAARRRATTSR